MHRLPALASIGLATLLWGAGVIAATGSYSIAPVGLYGPDYGGAAGTNLIWFTNNQGQAAGAALGGANGAPAWVYDGNSTVRVGFTGAAYTQANGLQNSEVVALNNQGQALGYSTRFITGVAPDAGQDVWLYGNGSTLQLGYTGDGYVRSDGYRTSDAYLLNDLGQVAGGSTRYSGSAFRGTDAWFFNGSSTVQLGFTGAGYTHADGTRISAATHLSSQGQVAGLSNRYSGTINRGQDAWLHSGGTTVQVGFTGVGYEQTFGFRSSEVSLLNDQGQAAGRSLRYSSLTGTGQDAWLFTAGSTLQIGLNGAGYQRSDGYRASTARFLNQQGQVAGDSNRYSGSTSLGVDAWLYDGTITVQIGLTGSGYERSDGYRFSSLSALNDQGDVLGSSARYSGSTDLGRDTWIADSAGTLRIGLVGAGYQRSDGYRYSNAAELNDQGAVAGYSNRYSGATALGQDAWLYADGATIQLGMTGAGFQRNDGYRYSDVYALGNGAVEVPALNDLGQVVGISRRYNGSTQVGQSAWYYDSLTAQIFDLTLSVRPSDGYADSVVSYLGEDGLALGSYKLFDQVTSADLGYRAFLFTMEDGMLDLGALVSDPLSFQDWAALASAIAADGQGGILGYGKLTGATGQAAYALQANAVPVPAAAWFLASGLVALGFARRRPLPAFS